MAAWISPTGSFPFAAAEGQWAACWVPTSRRERWEDHLGDLGGCIRSEKAQDTLIDLEFSSKFVTKPMKAGPTPISNVPKSAS